ncbi:MAG: hypothetical protein GY898_14625 [Proteobacteria bacterium]|nr:hypothetical protein [Pseudomonadota bacterium]
MSKNKQAAKAPPAPPPPEGFVTRLGKDIAEVTPLLALIPGILGYVMVNAAMNPELIELDKMAQAAERWHGDDFANLAWLGLVFSGVLFAVGRSRERTATLSLLGVSTLALFGCTVATFSLAWVHGRENYWDAYHFAALLWTVFGTSVLSFASFKVAGDRGSVFAQVLVGVSAVTVLLCLFVWTYTWSPLVQDFEGWIARTLWQMTHG